MTSPLTRRQAWIITLVATLTMAVSYVDRQTFSVLAPTLSRTLGLSDAQYGVLASAFSFAYLATTPLAGRVLDRLGARRGLMLAVGLWSLVAALHSAATGFASLLLLRVLLGVAESPSFPGAAQSVHRVLPPAERARGLGILFTGSSLGAMVAAPLASGLESVFTFRGAFIGTAMVGLLWVPVWRAVTSTPAARQALDAAPSRENDAQGPAPSLFAVLGSEPAIGRAMLAVIASAPVAAFVFLWAAKYLDHRFHLSQAEIGAYLFFPPLFFDLGSIAFGDWGTRRYRAAPHSTPDLPFVVAASLLLAIGLVPACPTPVAVLAALGVAMAGSGGVFALLSAEMLMRVSPRVVSQAGGWTASAQSVAYVLTSLAVGAAVESTRSYVAVLVGLSAWCLPFAALWLRAGTRTRAAVPGLCASRPRARRAWWRSSDSRSR